MVGNVAVIARTVEIPVIVDADTGYGSELNVIRTMNEYERAGVAAIHIEDQVSPKRCGHPGPDNVRGNPVQPVAPQCTYFLPHVGLYH